MATVSIISIAVNPLSRLEDGAKGERFLQRCAGELESVDKGIATLVYATWAKLATSRYRMMQETCRIQNGGKASQYGRTGSLPGQESQFVTGLRPRARRRSKGKAHLCWQASRGAPDSVRPGFCVTIAQRVQPGRDDGDIAWKD